MTRTLADYAVFSGIDYGAKTIGTEAKIAQARRG